ncbi:MAG TPA: DUF4383 domain-containing protein [Thermodesulfobacteriota bacterium]|nr:DUF4383 domain-containing protein [Thermodesulfobacteriota bacterium]
MAKKLAWLFGIVFVLVGILGFIPNPIVGHNAVFHTNAVHNLVHLIIGVFLIIGGTQGEATASKFLVIFGVVYLLVAILGFFSVDASGRGMLLGLVAINVADNWLHVVLAVALIGTGLMAGKTRPVTTTAP